MELYKLSKARKIAITVAAVLYGLAMLGHGNAANMYMILGVSLFFIAIVAVLLMWLK